MLKPSEIDLLRQDLQQALKVLGHDEIEDAQWLLQRHGFIIKEFKIVDQADPSPAYPAPLTGIVTVVRESNQTVQSYEAGHGSSWLAQFEIDLKSGAFGPP